MKKAVFMSRGCSREKIDKVFSPGLMAQIKKYAEIYPEVIDAANLIEHKEFLKDTDFIFSTWGMPSLSEEEIEEYYPNLKAVFYAAGSVQGFARQFLNRGVSVISSWAANAVPVAEYTLAQILLANKGFLQNTKKTKIDNKSAKDYSDTYTGNYSVKVGILGAGMIGRKVIELLKPFNIEILVFDPFLTDEKAKELNVKKCSLSEVFSQCQTISNHIANLPATVGILNREHFSKMLPNATFINTGRGAQVVEKDLIDALKECPARTAILDVTYPEPPASDSEFFNMENVFLSSHIAGSMSNEIERMGCYAVEEFIHFIEGKDLKYSVTLKMLETMA